jgi:uncharacterized repeat protein (TIGR01451 family)
MKGKAQLLALLAIFLAFSFFFYLSIAQEAMNSLQNLTTDKNSNEQSTSTTLIATSIPQSQTVETSTTLPEASQTSTTTLPTQTSTTLESTTSLPAINETTTSTFPKAKISLKLDVKKKITRGEGLLLKVNVTNEGDANAKNVKVTVGLPNGFSTDYLEKVCDVIEANSSCELEFSVKSNLSTQLGENEIKVRVSYE